MYGILDLDFSTLSYSQYYLFSTPLIFRVFSTLFSGNLFPLFTGVATDLLFTLRLTPSTIVRPAASLFICLRLILTFCLALFS